MIAKPPAASHVKPELFPQATQPWLEAGKTLRRRQKKQEINADQEKLNFKTVRTDGFPDRC
jgi:hypothetical protein